MLAHRLLAAAGQAVALAPVAAWAATATFQFTADAVLWIDVIRGGLDVSSGNTSLEIWGCFSPTGRARRPTPSPV